MPVTDKDIFEVLGIDLDPATIENSAAFKTLFEKSFTSKKSPDAETIKNIIGHEFGALGTVLKKELKKRELEFSLSDEEVKSKKAGQLVEYVLSEIDKKYTSEIEALKKAAPVNNDQAIKDLEAERDRFKLKATEEKQARESALSQFDQEKQGWNSEKKNIKRDVVLSRINEKEIKWATTADKYKKLGFDSEFNTKYKLELSDDESDIIPLNQKGERIPHPKKTGEFLNYAELKQKEMVEANLWEMNEQGRNQNRQTTQNQNQNNNNQNNNQNQNRNDNQNNNNRPVGAPERKAAAPVVVGVRERVGIPGLDQ